MKLLLLQLDGGAGDMLMLILILLAPPSPPFSHLGDVVAVHVALLVHVRAGRSGLGYVEVARGEGLCEGRERERVVLPAVSSDNC